MSTSGQDATGPNGQTVDLERGLTSPWDVKKMLIELLGCGDVERYVSYWIARDAPIDKMLACTASGAFERGEVVCVAAIASWFWNAACKGEEDVTKIEGTALADHFVRVRSVEDVGEQMLRVKVFSYGEVQQATVKRAGLCALFIRQLLWQPDRRAVAESVSVENCLLLLHVMVHLKINTSNSRTRRHHAEPLRRRWLLVLQHQHQPEPASKPAHAARAPSVQLRRDRATANPRRAPPPHALPPPASSTTGSSAAAFGEPSSSPWPVGSDDDAPLLLLERSRCIRLSSCWLLSNHASCLLKGGPSARITLPTKHAFHLELPPELSVRLPMIRSPSKMGFHKGLVNSEEGTR